MGWRDTIRPAEPSIESVEAAPKRSWRDTIQKIETPEDEYERIERPESSLTSDLQTIKDAWTTYAGGVGLGITDEAAGFGGGVASLLSGDGYEKGYREMKNRELESKAAAHERSPIASGVAEFAGAMSSGGPLKAGTGLGGLVNAAGQGGALAGFGESGADILGGEWQEGLQDTVTGAGVSMAMPLAFKGISSTAAKVGNSNFGKAFKGGGEVRKFNNPDEATHLANQISDGVEGAYQGAYKEHSAARKGFSETQGKDVIDGSDIVEDLNRFAARHGDTNSKYGKLSDDQREALSGYMKDLSQPQEANFLYSMWDDLNRTKKQWETVLGNNTTEYSKQLGELMKGIKRKLHGVSDDLAQKDAGLAEMLGKRDLVKSAAKDTTAESFLSTLGTRNKGNRRAAVDELLSPEVLAQIDNYQTWKGFQGQGGFGSDHGLRNASMVGSGAAIAGAPGAVVASVMSSPRTQLQLLTHAGDAYAKFQARIPNLPPKFKSVLEAATQRGGNATAVTHFLLSAQDAEYRQLMGDIED